MKKTTHEHMHQHCQHPRLKYCRDCQKPYCLDCGQEWAPYAFAYAIPSADEETVRKPCFVEIQGTYYSEPLVAHGNSQDCKHIGNS